MYLKTNSKQKYPSLSQNEVLKLNKQENTGKPIQLNYNLCKCTLGGVHKLDPELSKWVRSVQRPDRYNSHLT